MPASTYKSIADANISRVIESNAGATLALMMAGLAEPRPQSSRLSNTHGHSMTAVAPPGHEEILTSASSSPIESLT